MGVRVAVAGASGYAGGELLRLIAGHPEFEIVAATAHANAGAAGGLGAPAPGRAGPDASSTTDPAVLAGADLVFLALPHGESAAVAAQLPPRGPGGRPRRRPPAARPGRLGQVLRRAARRRPGRTACPSCPASGTQIAASTRVAATGCYAVATILALAPLIGEGLARPDDVVVVAASGTTGAGRALKNHLLASEVMGDVSAYKVGAHQHTAEIKQASGARSLSFTPMLAPMPRGILATVTAVPAGAGDVHAGHPRRPAQARTQAEPFVQVLPDGDVAAHQGHAGHERLPPAGPVDGDSGRLLVVSAIDNLGKGAAGQAVQCANLMLGLPETAGLSTVGVTCRERRPPRRDSGPAASPPACARRRRAGRRPGRQRRPGRDRGRRLHRATGSRPPRCCGASRCCGPASSGPWCSTPAGPTPAPGRRASRTPTPPRSTPRPASPPRRRPAGRRAGRRRGLLDRPDRRAAADGQAAARGRRRGAGAVPRRRAGGRPGHHDHRHPAQDHRGRPATAGRSAAWPRAPACSPPAWPPCSACSPPTRSPTRRLLQEALRRGDRGHVRPGRLGRLPVHQRHRAAAGQRGVGPCRRPRTS